MIFRTTSRPRPKSGARRWLKALLEANEELMNKYLENGDLDAADIKQGIRLRTIASEIVPMFCGPRSRTRACKPCSTPLSNTCRLRRTSPVSGMDDDDKPVERKASDEENSRHSRSRS